jgi:hypothetical protein
MCGFCRLKRGPNADSSTMQRFHRRMMALCLAMPPFEEKKRKIECEDKDHSQTINGHGNVRRENTRHNEKTKLIESAFIRAPV